MSFVNVFFAVEAPYGAFFKPVGGNKAVCSMVPFGHPVRANANFCDQCGNKTTMRAVEEPTEPFKAFCESREVEPRYAFHQLTEDGWEWSDDTSESEVAPKITIGLYRVQTVDNYERRAHQIITALGIKLDSIHEDLAAKLSALAFTAEDLTKYEAPVREVAAAFGINGTPKLYVQLYI